MIDPQAAIPPAPTVADVNPELASSIPTPPPSYSARPPPSSSTFASTFNNVNTGSSQTPSNGNGNNNGEGIDWSSSFHGLSTVAFAPETAAILMQPLNKLDVEIKPDGIVYLPEIKYRRILNQAFGPGGWGLAPRGEMVIGEKVVTREFALVVHGRYVPFPFYSV